MDTTTQDIYTVNLSDLTSGPSFTISNTVTTGPGYIWPNTAPAWTFTDSDMISPNSGKISLSGDDADIEINGESVVGLLRDIRDRLNILKVSEEMEAEWDELRALREQYEAKLMECRDKSQAWKALKQPG